MHNYNVCTGITSYIYEHMCEGRGIKVTIALLMTVLLLLLLLLQTVVSIFVVWQWQLSVVVCANAVESAGKIK